MQCKPLVGWLLVHCKPCVECLLEHCKPRVGWLLEHCKPCVEWLMWHWSFVEAVPVELNIIRLYAFLVA